MNMEVFLNKSNNIEKDSYIWNMVGSILMAFQSVIRLMILTRTVGLAEAGVFTIAYANATLFSTIGKYGMRNFQISDVKNQFSFSDFRTSRWITTFAMIIASVAYVFYMTTENNYSMEKSMIIIWMCLFKVVDVVEDVYHGEYQKRGRLDIASKAISLRIIATILIFTIVVIVANNLLTALVISTIFTSILLIVFLKWTCAPFREGTDVVNKSNVWFLLKTCFPLFAGSFLSFYIGNAPKYAIDAQLTDELQACYGFIAMPVFVIGLLNSFIFNPMLYHMSCLWIEGKKKEFLKKSAIQIGIIAGITVICVVGAYIIGIPVLSVLYNTNLHNYKAELLILLVGGGLLGFSELLNAVITIIRFQKSLVWGYGIVAIMAYFLSNYMVRKYEMMGAAMLYMILMGILCVIFCILFVLGATKSERKEDA